MIGSKTVILTFLIAAVSGSALHGSCEKNEQCGTVDTYCRNGTCICKDGFAVNEDHCVQLVVPEIACTHRSKCNLHSGHKGLFCHEKRCVCRSFHHFHNSQCVKSKGLDQECTSDHQCYCGEDCKEKIECAEGMCACKKGFKRYSTRCIVDPRVLDSGPQTSQANSFSVHFVCRLLTMMLFVKIS
jgi:hypothetical protein